MPYEIRYEDPIYVVTFLGIVTKADIVRLLAEAPTIEVRDGRAVHRVVDLTACSSLEVTGDDIQSFARSRVERVFPNAFKTAMVAADPIHYGYARMFQIMMQHGQIVVALFPTVATAKEWLAEPGLELPAVQWEPPTQRRPPQTHAR